MMTEHQVIKISCNTENRDFKTCYNFWQDVLKQTVKTYRKSMISAISDASTVVDVWEFFPNTSTNTLKSIDRVCDIFQKMTVKQLIPKK